MSTPPTPTSEKPKRWGDVANYHIIKGKGKKRQGKGRQEKGNERHNGMGHMYKHTSRHTRNETREERRKAKKKERMSGA